MDASDARVQLTDRFLLAPCSLPTFAGAAHATFIDMAPNCIETALENAERCGFGGQVSSCCAMAQDALTEPAKYGLSGMHTALHHKCPISHEF
jgi:hypothetical protein